MPTLSTNPIKGFRDIYPEDYALQSHLFSAFRNVAKLYGYQEYEGPLLEPFALYAAKSGEELVKKQTFLLKDRNGKKLALRPELTPTLARMVAKKRFSLPIPIKWFSIGARFRYEAPQKGRGREFYQMDADLVGINTPEADAEILSLAIKFLTSFNITEKDFVIKINDRAFLENKCKEIGIAQNKFISLIHLIDKKDKLPHSVWEKNISTFGLTKNQRRDLMKILISASYKESERIQAVYDCITINNYKKYIRFDPTIVRGLDYYTGIVFEARDRKNKFRSLLGGGRYDNLVALFNTTPLSGIGFACGDMVLLEFLQSLKKLSDTLQNTTTQVLITVFAPDEYASMITVANALREQNISCEVYPDPNARLDKQLKYADKKNIPFALIQGPIEKKKNTLILKNLSTHRQKTITLSRFLSSPITYIS